MCPSIKMKKSIKSFVIPAFITANQEKVFYVVYADEDPGAVAWTSANLFHLLHTSERVIANESNTQDTTTQSD